MVEIFKMPDPIKIYCDGIGCHRERIYLPKYVKYKDGTEEIYYVCSYCGRKI